MRSWIESVLHSMRQSGFLKSAAKNLRKNLPGLAAPAAAIFVWCLITQPIFGTVCPMMIVTGLPCPACGMTRATLCILSGRFAEAAAFNVMAYLWAPLLAAILTAWAAFDIPAERWTRILIPAFLVTMLYYAYRLIFCFPGHEPMRLHERNLLRMVFETVRRMCDMPSSFRDQGTIWTHLYVIMTS